MTVTSDRHHEYQRVVHRVAAWARQQRDIVGVAVVGSWASGQAHMDSDVDLVVLTDEKERYIADIRWVSDAAGEAAQLQRTEDWGPLTERRVVLRSGLVVEFGFVRPSWASVDPVDPGTARVVDDGWSPLVDPEGTLARLGGAVAGV
jgi:predicted nucleotidyltransferase